MKPTDKTYFERECCKPFDLQGGPDGVLLMHGFTGSIAHMRPLGEALHAKGYTVRGINLPGHASSEEDMARTGWQEWLHAAKEAALEMLSNCKTVTVCGLSMGGVLALLVAEQMKVTACVTISAPMATKNKLLPLARVMAPLLPRIAWQPPTERLQELDAEYDCGYTGFPTAKGYDLHTLIRLARRNLFNINCPVLCVQSDADETIWAGSANCIVNNVSSEEKRVLWLKDVPHVCTISRELPAIAQGMDELLRRVSAQG